MKRLSIYAIALLMAIGSTVARAQQANSLYFLENAPMRHLINPAFQPLSKVYVAFPAIGYLNVWGGNNAFCMKDLLFVDPQTGQTITPLHPNANPNWLKNKPNNLIVDADVYINLFSLGFRINPQGYVHLNVSQHAWGSASLSTALLGINHITNGQIGPYRASANAMVYTDISLGYSHVINEQWTVGGKFKYLLGQAYVGAKLQDVGISTSPEVLHAQGMGELMVAAPLMWEKLPADFNSLDDVNIGELVGNDYMQLIKPAGMGMAVDLGATYKPIEMIEISASVTDLGFINWTKHVQGGLSLDTTFTGGEWEMSELLQSGDTPDDMGNDLLSGYSDALHINDIDLNPKAAARMLNANLNIGVEAKFWEERVGVGVLSRTRFYNSMVTEELTLGAALRPCHWFNMAATYSFINGHWGNMGAALSLAPYDGLMLTVAADYVPLSYAKSAESNLKLPYRTAGANVSFGIAIVAGTKPDQDRDGVLDRRDLCPLTPRRVPVDKTGCPFDTDHDGVFDYMDECPYTPAEAIGMVDSVGCPIDLDTDGIADYMDLCADTPAEAAGMLDENGCPLDTDGDGVADYLDQCPDTPAEAAGMVDEKGCPLDSDQDGVPDFIDMCADTPKEAAGKIDQYGCPLDSDTDGVYDYCDKCPDTPEEANNSVGTDGCPLDSDGDGLEDYKDHCPTVAGAKDNNGCPEVKREVRQLLSKAMTGIQFENGKATIKAGSYPILNNIAQTFIDNTSYYIEVQGHSDNVGNYKANIELSERRARAVRDYLIKKGVPADRMTAHGYGPDKPIADNKTKEGRNKNRRVEFNITFEHVTYESVKAGEQAE